MADPFTTGFAALGSLIGGKAASKGFKNAGNAASAVVDKSQSATTYAPGGAKAFTQQQNLLGLGDEAAGQAGFQNYLGSTGYRAQLQGGNDAITSSMAAGLGNKSGAADKARLRFGTGLANDYFQNYFNNLGGQSMAGQRADQFATGAKAGFKWDQYAGAGKAKSDMYNNVFGDIGYGTGKGAP